MLHIVLNASAQGNVLFYFYQILFCPSFIPVITNAMVCVTTNYSRHQLYNQCCLNISFSLYHACILFMLHQYSDLEIWNFCERTCTNLSCTIQHKRATTSMMNRNSLQTHCKLYQPGVELA